MNTAVVIDVLANDSGKRLQVVGADSPTQPGSIAVVSGDARSITYTPAPGYSGPDSFGYEIVDKDANTASAIVAVTVNHTGLGNDVP